MGDFFKKKSVAVLLIVAIIAVFVPLQTARADAVVNLANIITDISIDIVTADIWGLMDTGFNLADSMAKGIVQNEFTFIAFFATLGLSAYAYGAGGIAMSESTLALGTTAPELGWALVPDATAPLGFKAIAIQTVSTWSLVTTTYLTTTGVMAIGGVATIIAACVAGNNTICGGNEDAVLVMLPSVNSQPPVGCRVGQFSISPTFYIPSFNQGYVTESDTYVTDGGYDENGEPITNHTPIPAGAQRYQPSYSDNEGYITIDGCAYPDPNGTYAMVDGFGCVHVDPGETTPTSIDETKNKIALYRVTAPTSQFQNADGTRNNVALASWFMGIPSGQTDSQHKFGPGLWLDSGNNSPGPAKDRQEENLLAVYPYSKYCSGNKCTFPDVYNIPENSYVFYAAKILGDYTWLVENEPMCDDENRCIGGEPDVYYSSAKFLMNTATPARSAKLATFPWIVTRAYSMGDALYGPKETGALESCPVPVVKHTLNVTKAGAGTGTVTSAPAGISCGSDCSERFDESTSVTLTAAENVSSAFFGWSGACSGASTTCTVIMSSDKTVTATFIPRTLDINLSATMPLAGITIGSDWWQYMSGYRFKSTLKTDVAGTAQGPVSYTYNCGNGSGGGLGSSPNPIGAPDSSTYLCYYRSSSPVTASVRVTRGGLSADKSLALSGKPSVTVNFFATPSVGQAPLTSTVTAQVGGTAQGQITYEFNCGNGTLYRDITTSTQVAHQCTYGYKVDGAYTATVKVSRGGADPATASATIVTTEAPASCANGATNPTACTTCPSGKVMVSGLCIPGCTNGTNNPPACTTLNGVCANGATNPPTCTTFPPPPPSPSCPIRNVSPSDIRLGDTVTLTWSCQHAASCTQVANGDGFSTGSGPASLSGSDDARPSVASGEVRYGMTCGGASFTFPPVTVHSPLADITASASRVQTGARVTLTGTGTDVTRCKITDSFGNTVQPSSAAPGGSWSRTPTPTVASQTIYTLTCEVAAGADVTDSVTVNVVPLFQEF